MGNLKEKLKQIASKEKSTWLEDAKWRQDNDFWLETSQRIAIKILLELRKEKLTQKELADRLGIFPQQISKIVKGTENLTIETIRKIEVALNIKLIEIVNSDIDLLGMSFSVNALGQIKANLALIDSITEYKEDVSIKYSTNNKVSSGTSSKETNPYLMAA